MTMRKFIFGAFLSLSLFTVNAEAQVNAPQPEGYQAVPTELQGIWAGDCSNLSKGTFIIFGPDQIAYVVPSAQPSIQRTLQVIGTISNGNSYLISQDSILGPGGNDPFIVVDIVTRLNSNEIQDNARYLYHKNHLISFTSNVWTKCPANPIFSQDVSAVSNEMIPTDMQNGASLIALLNLHHHYPDIMNSGSVFNFPPFLTCMDGMNALQNNDNPRHQDVMWEVYNGWMFLDDFVSVKNRTPLGITMLGKLSSYEGSVAGFCQTYPKSPFFEGIAKAYQMAGGQINSAQTQ